MQPLRRGVVVGAAAGRLPHAREVRRGQGLAPYLASRGVCADGVNLLLVDLWLWSTLCWYTRILTRGSIG